MSRGAEIRAIAEFLNSASCWPSALVLEGEAGIGKTTLWFAAVEQARERGFRVLSARAAQPESVLAYASLADLLGSVDAAVFDELPRPQRVGLNRVLLRAEDDNITTDQRAVAAGFLSVIETLADTTPTVLAVDDLQWLDPSSAKVVAFVARRLSGRVGVLVTARTEPDGTDASWLQLPRPDDAIERIRVPPLNLGGLHLVLTEWLGHSFTRPKMVEIQEISGGNPFYALELARAMGAENTSDPVSLPRSLAELVRARIGRLGNDTKLALLAVACLASPTVELVAKANHTDPDHMAAVLGKAEEKGIVEIHGPRVQFTHPLLVRGVYSDTAPLRCREVHARLAEIVEEPELRARHLALAAVTCDRRTLQALDEAAEMACIRGAPTAAAELLDLAAELGGDTPERRIRSASHHFNAGDFARARALLEQTIEGTAAGLLRAKALSLLGVMETLEGSLPEAVTLLQRALAEAGDALALRVQILVPLSFAIWNVGRRAAALPTIDRAVVDAERLGQPHLLSQALSMRSLVRFLQGNGLDEAGVRRALELEDRQAPTPVVCRPAMHSAMLLAFAGHLESASDAMQSIGRQCSERGEESEQVFIAFHSVLVEIWRGNFTEATSIAEHAIERALLLGGDLPHAVALTMRNALAAYAGHEDEVRRDAGEAYAAMQASGSFVLAAWPTTTLGFLEVSLGNYEAALTALKPLLSTLDPEATGLFVAPFVPDAVEALVHLGHFSEAEPLIDALERNGRRLDRPWMLAVGARCRSMLLGACGDVDSAVLAAQQAMVEHDRLPMPFERARTQLLLGQLQRRQRLKGAAAASLEEALRAFEDLGTPLWANRVRAEMSRTKVTRQAALLTPSERRVAELAASGMTNRDVGAALFISPKTVAANLARVYHKLGIHSRAELGSRMAAPEM